MSPAAGMVPTALVLLPTPVVPSLRRLPLLAGACLPLAVHLHARCLLCWIPLYGELGHPRLVCQDVPHQPAGQGQEQEEAGVWVCVSQVRVPSVTPVLAARGSSRTGQQGTGEALDATEGARDAQTLMDCNKKEVQRGAHGKCLAAQRVPAGGSKREPPKVKQSQGRQDVSTRG